MADKVHKLSKADGYMHRVFCVEYDLAAMVEAYGAETIHWMVDEIAAGRIVGRQDVARWAAHKDLYKFASTEAKGAKVAVVKRSEKIVKRGRAAKPARNNNASAQ